MKKDQIGQKQVSSMAAVDIMLHNYILLLYNLFQSFSGKIR